ncbi:uncharacterized protein J3R85_012196 [Psidium guajava]|nr:uncharacterized protein J3R85_012196 [Psidium guajava]
MPPKWDEPIIRGLFDTQLANEILATPLNPLYQKDNLVWTATKTGVFTAKSAYNVICEEDRIISRNQPSTSFTPSRRLWHKIWQLQVPPKIKFFTWKLCHNAIPLKDNLLRRKITGDAICSLCKTQPETSEHIFLLCPWTRNVWEHPKIRIQITDTDCSRMDKWLDELLEKRDTHLGLEELAVTLWEIWKARNNSVFRHKNPNFETLIEAVETTISSYRRWNKKDTETNRGNSRTPRIWDPPKNLDLKMNIDGSFDPGSTFGGIAGVVRDSSGVVIDGFARKIQALSPLQTEALALLEALKFLSLRTSSKEKTYLQTDCSSLVGAVLGTELIPWEIEPIVHEA